MKKVIHDENASYWTQIYLEWIKLFFDAMKKRWYNKNIFHGLQICFDWIKIYYDIIKKGDIMEYILLIVKLFWLNENIFSYHLNF